VEATGADVPFLQLGPLHPIAGMVAGAFFTVLGLLAGLGLRNYLRALIRALQRTLPAPKA
jgi:hypothetical protein